MNDYPPIIEGATYRYTAPHPRGAKGQLYRFVRMVLDVPNYQQKMLMEALGGDDRGLWFVTTPANFETRYVLVSKGEQ
jgi:hypothetical protein